MNGQPTAQNNRETGVDGDLPAFRNWNNPDHVQQLADLSDVDALKIPHWAPPAHAMQIFRFAEQGSIGFLWIAGTNPAVSMPDLPRMRRILGGEQTFVVVNEAYRNETTELADVVLPSALWGERPGIYTNVDRTVHLSDQAVEPPGRPGVIFASGSITPGGWASETAAGARFPGGPSLRMPSTPGSRRRGVARVTTAACPTRSFGVREASSGRAMRSTRTVWSGYTPARSSRARRTTASLSGRTSCSVRRPLSSSTRR